MEIDGKRFLVLGLARTGCECARFLVNRGAQVSVSDRRPEPELKQEMASLAGVSIDYYLGGEDRSALTGVDCVIPSPGVPAENPLLRAAVARGIAVLSEIELAHRFLPVPLVAITGMDAVTLEPAAGAQGELTGLLVIHACLKDTQGNPRKKVLIPDSAHGTNPASVSLTGSQV